MKWKEDLLALLPEFIRSKLYGIPDTVSRSIEEIRIRAGRPLMLTGCGREFFIGKNNALIPTPYGAFCISRQDCQTLLECLCDYSIYAIEDELRNGYLSLQGGYRVGLVGRAITDHRKLVRITDCSGFNIRISRQIFGAADRVIPYIHNGVNVYHTLIISPPMLGKTTLLRDIARQISNGVSGLPGQKVGIVDERSEIAACMQGIAQYDVGLRTDVLDGCPKATGMMLMLRSMSPQVIISDEIGREEELPALEEAFHAGVSLVISAHGDSTQQIRNRPVLKRLMDQMMIQRYIIIGNSIGVGTIERIEDEHLSALLSRPFKTGREVS